MNTSLHIPQKSLGQNFLTNSSIVDKLIETAAVKAHDIVLEIGPGMGIITGKLSDNAKHVYAIDLDSKLLQIAKTNTETKPNITFIHHDILTFDTSQIQTPYKVVGAIPYNITSPIIHKFLIEKNKPASLTLIIQKEVAEKIAAILPHANYMSMFIQSQGEVHISVKRIAPGSFNPPPKVESSVIHIDLKSKIPNIEPAHFSEFLHKGFKHPRKMLRKVFNLAELQNAEIDPQNRPAQLTLAQWVTLYQNIQ